MSYKVINEIVDSFAQASDDEVLSALTGLMPLPDGDDSRWDDEQFWQEHAYRYLALASVAANRKLPSAIPLLLDKICYGDPGETMRGMCHCFETIVEPDYSSLYDICSHAANSSRNGTRMWALFQLHRLRDERSRVIFENALDDECEYVRENAEMALDSLKNVGKG